MADTDQTSPEIDVKQAISIAKAYVREVFEDELRSPTILSGRREPTLEEVWYDEAKRAWFVTVGIRHRLEVRSGPAGRESIPAADYKTVAISARDGRPLSIKLHDGGA